MGSRKILEAQSQERDEKPAQPAVAVQEWMNGFKLYMDQASLDQDGCFAAFEVQKLFKIAPAVHNVAEGRRNKNGVTGTSFTDPVLGFSKLTGQLLATASLSQQ